MLNNLEKLLYSFVLKVSNLNSKNYTDYQTNKSFSKAHIIKIN